MKNFASSLGNKKFLVFGCGFSGNIFAKKIRAHGLKALTSRDLRKMTLTALSLIVKTI